MVLAKEYTEKGHPFWGGGRPRTTIPSKEELIELGKDLVEWASAKHKKGEPLRVRFCDWYTEKGFIMKQWDEFRDHPDFSPFYERARALMSQRYLDGTVNPSIAHRYLRIYDGELRREEDKDLDREAVRKATAAQGDREANAAATTKAVLEAIQDSKRAPTQ